MMSLVLGGLPTRVRAVPLNYAGNMPLPPLVDPVVALSDGEQTRMSRHRMLAGLGETGQRRIAAARVGVIGAGGLGSPIVLALAAAGVGELVVFDDDEVEASNLGRQIIHRKQDVGAPKADSAARVAAELSDTRVRIERHRLTATDAAGRLSGVDLVLDGTDSFESREIVARACEELGVPLVWGTVQEFAGQVTVFWSRPPAGVEPVLLHDLYPPGSEAPACSVVGVFGPLCIQVGSLMASEALKLITGIGRPLIGRLALLDALAGTQREVPLRTSRATDARRPDRGTGGIAPEVDDIGDETLIDVREAWELASGMIAGSNHVPLARLLTDVGGTVDELDLRGRTVVVVCQVGARARVAAGALRAAGVDAVVLRGGIDAWARRQGQAS